MPGQCRRGVLGSRPFWFRLVQRCRGIWGQCWGVGQGGLGLGVWEFVAWGEHSKFLARWKNLNMFVSIFIEIVTIFSRQNLGPSDDAFCSTKHMETNGTWWKPKVHVFPELWLVQALAFTSVLPWSICLLCYLILHWAFPYDRRILAEEKEVCLERHGGRLYSDSEGSDVSDNEDLLEYLDWAGAGNPVTAPALKLIIVSLCQSADRLRASDLCCCCQSSV